MVILSDLSEFLVRGVLMMHVEVSLTYGDLVGKWFIARKERMNSIFLNLMRGEMSLDEYWEIFCDDPKRPNCVTAEGLNRIFFQEIRGEVSGTREVLEGIIAHSRSLISQDQEMLEGRPAIIMVSDHIRECVDTLHAAHPKVFDLFSYEVWSFERGEIKSDSGFFDRLLRDLGFRAREALFIDDLLVNCKSAAWSNIKTIRFTNVSDLISSLESNRFVIDPAVKAKNRARVG